MIGVDSNILIHAHRRDADLHEPACARVMELAESGRPWAICHHSLVEFYGVVTRPKLWKEPSTPEQAWNQVLLWKESPMLRILYDQESSINLLGALLLKGNVVGATVHDGRIASCCLLHGVTLLWTIDRDFSRFPDLATSNPLL